MSKLNIGKLAKFIVAVGGTLALLGKGLADGHLSTAEAGDVGVAALTAITVYVVPNVDGDLAQRILARIEELVALLRPQPLQPIIMSPTSGDQARQERSLSLSSVPGKALGRRPPKNARALMFADHVTTVPEHPISDLAPDLAWPMDHNDTVGCCVVAGLDHFRDVVYTSLSAPYTPWTDAELLALYQTQNPSFRGWQDGGTRRDGGMDIQTLLEYLVDQGVILGFAKVDHSNVEQMKAAIYLGLGIVTGEVLTAKNMREQVWDYYPRDVEEGGHCTLSVGYDPTEAIVSWGALYQVTDAFLGHNIEEAWFVLTQAHVDHAGFRQHFDLASFAAAYTAMTGRPFPVAVTPPAPVPAPTPAPDPEPAPEPPAPGELTVTITLPADDAAVVARRAGKKDEDPAAWIEHTVHQAVKK